MTYELCPEGSQCNAKNAGMKILKTPDFAMGVAINWNSPARNAAR
jgi:hypothetical protein